jgi:hypothetical protein
MAGALSDRQRIRLLIQRVAVAILMTADDRGTFAGRPMLHLLLDNDSHIYFLYFLTHHSSRKVTQVMVEPQVAVTIADAHCLRRCRRPCRCPAKPEAHQRAMTADVPCVVP